MCKLALQWEAKKKDMCLGVLGVLLPESLLIFLLPLTTTNSNPMSIFPKETLESHHLITTSIATSTPLHQTLITRLSLDNSKDLLSGFPEASIFPLIHLLRDCLPEGIFL